MQTPQQAVLLAVVLCTQLLSGCATSARQAYMSRGDAETASNSLGAVMSAASDEKTALIRQVFYEEEQPTPVPPTPDEGEPLPPESPPASGSELDLLIWTAVEQNPQLTGLYREYQSAAAKSQYVDKLPDPKLGANIFGNPIETASGSQQANMSLSQVIPWLAQLDARQQQACFEAFAIRSEYAAERLRVIAGIRTGWYRLYVIDKQIETAVANQELLESLIRVANARIATGNASQGDVLLGTLELSKLEERLLTYRKQRRAVEAEMNRLAGRSASIPISSPKQIPHGIVDADAETIKQIAFNSQPELAAARLRTQATRWGIEVARLSRRPELMVSANYFFTDNNRPSTSVVKVGEDPWSIGMQVSVPLWWDKYDAMQNEAGWKHQAANSSVAQLTDRYDALILDLLAEAERAAETAELYSTTILPQARQTLSADQQSYGNGSVEFDRVIEDYRNLLTLELGYHQAIGELAIANARIWQAAGRDIALSDLKLTEID